MWALRWTIILFKRFNLMSMVKEGQPKFFHTLSTVLGWVHASCPFGPWTWASAQPLGLSQRPVQLLFGQRLVLPVLRRSPAFCWPITLLRGWISSAFNMEWLFCVFSLLLFSVPSSFPLWYHWARTVAYEAGDRHWVPVRSSAEVKTQRQ